MPDTCIEYTFALGTTRKINDGSGVSTLVTPTLDSIQGLDGRPIRARIVPRGVTDGGQKLTSRFGPRLITFAGDINIYTPGGELWDPGKDLAGYLAAFNTLVDGWKADLEAKLNTAFNLTYTPTGGSLVTRSVTYGMEGAEWKLGGDIVQNPTYSFGLVCEVD